MSPCEVEIERTMKKSKAREWTCWEMTERIGYSYSMVHLGLTRLVEKKIVERRLLEKDGRMGRPGFGYWLKVKQMPKSTKKQDVTSNGKKK